MPWLKRDEFLICFNKSRVELKHHFLVEKCIIVANCHYFAAITEAAEAHLRDLSDDARLGGLGYGTWIFLAVVGISMITLVVCAICKLNKERTFDIKKI